MPRFGCRRFALLITLCAAATTARAEEPQPASPFRSTVRWSIGASDGHRVIGRQRSTLSFLGGDLSALNAGAAHVDARGLQVTPTFDQSQPTSIDFLNNDIDIGRLTVFDLARNYTEWVATAGSSFESVAVYRQFADGPASTGFASGWRVDAFGRDWSIGAGDETEATWRTRDDVAGELTSGPVRSLAKNLRFGAYQTVGLRATRASNRIDFTASGRTNVDALRRGLIGFESLLDVDDSFRGLSQTNDTYLIGPQLGAGVVTECSMFRFEAMALGVMGYSRSDLKEVVARIDAPRSIQRRSVDQVGFHGETRLLASCQLTQRWRFDATWRWYVTGPTYAAAESVTWLDPDFGIRATDSAADSGSDWFLGLTYTH